MLKDKVKCEEVIFKMFPDYHIAVNVFQLFFVDHSKPYYVKIDQDSNKTAYVGINASETLTAIKLWNKKLSL